MLRMDRHPAAPASPASLPFSSASAKPSCPAPCFPAVPLTPSSHAAAIVPFSAEPFRGRPFHRPYFISRAYGESGFHTLPRPHPLIECNAASPASALEPENGLTDDEDCLRDGAFPSRSSLTGAGAPDAGTESEGLLDTYDRAGGKVELVQQWWPWFPVWPELPIKVSFSDYELS